MSKCELLALCLLASTATGEALAQAQAPIDTSTAEVRARAKTLFIQGSELGDAAKLEQACQTYKESQNLEPTLGTLMRLATCYAEQGKTASAWTSFFRATELARQRGDKAGVALAQKRVSELERRLSFLTVVVDKTSGDTRMVLDGKPLSQATAGIPLPMDPGVHRLEVSQTDRQSWTTEFVIEPGPTVHTVDVPDLQRLPSIAPARQKFLEPLRDERDQGSRTQVAGSVLLGVGVVGMIAGGYFRVRAYKESEEADRFCRGTLCTMEGVEGYASAHRAAWYSNAAFGVGLAGLASGLYLLASPWGSSSQGTGLRIEGGLGNLRIKGRF